LAAQRVGLLRFETRDGNRVHAELANCAKFVIGGASMASGRLRRGLDSRRRKSDSRDLPNFPASTEAWMPALDRQQGQLAAISALLGR
jgi:hypothetical protein